MSIDIGKDELKEVIREVIREELAGLAVSLTPFVSDTEMNDIEKTFSADDFKDGEFTDATAWLGR